MTLSSKAAKGLTIMETDARGFPRGDLRVSDADRDRALTELTDAYEAGRITAEEFDERSGQALSARTGKELRVPLADLPVIRTPAPPRPTAEGRQVPWVNIGASVLAAVFARAAVANALRPPLTLAQRQLIQQNMARYGIRIPLPPAQGFDWIGTLVPAIIALALVTLVVARVRRGRARRAQAGKARAGASGVGR
jgi:hypothetical protein